MIACKLFCNYLLLVLLRRDLQRQLVEATSSSGAVHAMHELVHAALEPRQARFMASCGLHLHVAESVPPHRYVADGTEAVELEILAMVLLHRIVMANQSDSAMKEALLGSQVLRRALVDVLDMFGSHSAQLVDVVMSLLCLFDAQPQRDPVYQQVMSTECLKTDDDPIRRRLLQALHEQVQRHGTKHVSIVVNYFHLLARSLTLDVALEMDVPLLFHELVVSLMNFHCRRRDVLIPMLNLVEIWMKELVDAERHIRGVNIDPMPPTKVDLLPALGKVLSNNGDDPEVIIAVCTMMNIFGRYDRIMGPSMKEHPLYPYCEAAIYRWGRERPDVLEAAFRMLLRCSLFQPTAQFIVRDGTFKHVLDGLRRNQYNADIMSDGLMAIAHLSAPDSEPLKKYGGIELLKHLMKLHENSTQIFGSGCIAISNLTMFPYTNIDLLIRAGFHEMVVERALTLKLDVRFARAITRVLIRFASPIDEELRVRVVHSQMIDAICRICRVFAHCDPHEQQLLAISHSCVDPFNKYPKWKKLEVEAGYHKKLTDLVDFEEDPPDSGKGEQPASRQTQEWVVESLGRMGVGVDSNKQALLEYGCHRVICKLLRHHIDDRKFVVVCSQALFSLAVYGPCKAILARDGVVHNLGRVLRVVRYNADVFKAILMCLASLALGDKTIKQAMIDARVHRWVLNALQYIPHNAMVSTLGIVLLLRLVLDDGVLVDVAELEGLQDTLLDVVSGRYSMTTNSGENDLVNCGHTLMSNIYCGAVWAERRRRRRPPPGVEPKPGQRTIMHQKRYDPDKRDEFDLYAEHELEQQEEDEDELEPFPKSNDPIAIQRLSGMALHACPNCRKGLASELIMTVPKLTPADYELFAESGWFRRGGVQLFQFRQMHAHSCNTSEIRVRLADFDASQSNTFKRAVRRAKNAGVRVRTVRPRFSEDAFQMYYRYQMERHESEFCSKESYQSHLLDSPLIPTTGENGIEYGTFHQEYFVGDHLAGVGVIDVMPHSLVSIYYFFDIDKEYAKLSLGVYSCLQEIEYARELNRRGADIRYYYLGNFCPSNSKLAYKADYQPTEVYCAHLSKQWQPHSAKQPSHLFRDVNGAPTPPYGYSPYFTHNLPGASCDGNLLLKDTRYRQIRMNVGGEEMSVDAMLRRFYCHPMCAERLRLTLGELVESVSDNVLQRMVVHVAVIPGVLQYGDPMEEHRFGVKIYL